jgi:phosphopantothenoylcysteine decarboxylase/phosphopantothenate--cysteine ligase
MGFAIAAELQSRGAEVVLIAGPVSLPTPPGVQRIDVETALEMAARVRETVPQADVCVMAAAISDFRAASVSPAKLKRSAGPPKVELVHNPDILASLSQWAPRAFRVGFAAEVGESSAEAYRKLAERNVDWIVANDVSRADIGFDSDDNEVIVYRREREPFKISKRSKPLVARALVDALAIELRERGILDAKIRAT